MTPPSSHPLVPGIWCVACWSPESHTSLLTIPPMRVHCYPPSDPPLKHSRKAHSKAHSLVFYAERSEFLIKLVPVRPDYSRLRTSFCLLHKFKLTAILLAREIKVFVELLQALCSSSSYGTRACCSSLLLLLSMLPASST